MKIPVRVDEPYGCIVDADGCVISADAIVSALNRQAAAEKLAEAVEVFRDTLGKWMGDPNPETVFVAVEEAADKLDSALAAFRGAE